MKSYIFAGFTLLLAACAMTPVGGDSDAEPEDRAAQAADGACQEKTCLEAIHVGPSHWVELHQNDVGIIGIFERAGASDEMVAKTPAGGAQVALVDTYRSLRPGATVPAHLVAADARFQSMLRAHREEADLARARVQREIELHPDQAEAIEEAARPAPPPEFPPSMSEPSPFYTADEQWSFYLNQCAPNSLQMCYQGAGTAIDTGTTLGNFTWSKSFAMVGSDSLTSGVFTVKTYGGASVGWQTSLSGGMGNNGGVASWIIPGVPYDGGIFSGINSRLSGHNGLASLGQGTSGACGAQGQAACSNGACGTLLQSSNASVPTSGTCVPCGAANQTACRNGTCATSYVKNSSNTCVHCGADGERLCAGGVCNSGLAPVEGPVSLPGNWCTTCGGSYQPACAGNVCSAGFFPVPLYGTTYCTPCGTDNAPTCAGGSCATIYFTQTNNICHQCGEGNMVACPGNVCSPWHFASGGTCHVCGGNPGYPACPTGPACGPSMVNVSGTCVTCGGAGQPACAGGCATGTVNVGGQCVTCGGAGQPACSGGACTPPNTNVGGTCTAPPSCNGATTLSCIDLSHPTVTCGSSSHPYGYGTLGGCGVPFYGTSYAGINAYVCQANCGTSYRTCDTSSGCAANYHVSVWHDPDIKCSFPGDGTATVCVHN